VNGKEKQMPSEETILAFLVDLLAEQNGIKVDYRIIPKKKGVENEKKKIKNKAS